MAPIPESDDGPGQGRCGTMVMLSTAQQIANFKVYKQFRPSLVVALSSRHAFAERWNHGIRKLVEADKGGFLEPSFHDTLQVNELHDVFRRVLAPILADVSGQTVVWAWTGAQKPHSVALFQLALDAAGHSAGEKTAGRHLLVYAEATRLVVEGQQDNVEATAPLTANEVLEVHNMRVEPRTPRPALVGPDGIVVEDDALFQDFRTGGPIRSQSWAAPGFIQHIEELADRITNDKHLGFDDVKKAFSRGVGRREATRFIDAYLRFEKRTPNDSLDKPLRAAKTNKTLQGYLVDSLNSADCRVMAAPAEPDPSPAPRVAAVASGELFERVAETRLRRWYVKRGYRWMVDLQFNLSVYHPAWDEDAREVGEFDCLMIGANGLFYAIDFKSAGKFGDFRRQNATVTLGGGTYARFFYCYPWLGVDLDLETDAIRIDRPGHEQRRVRGIVSMDGKLGASGIRFYSEDGDFHAELEDKLRLK